MGIHRQRADPVTDEDETRLWESGVISMDNAKALSYGVFFYNCKLFGFRGGDEHRDLQTDQYRLTDENGQKVLTFYGRNSKNVQGGLKQRKVEPKVIRQHEDLTNDRCVVTLFETYLRHIPKGDFYLRPLPSKFNEPIVFSSQKIGVNCLGKLMKTMFQEAGIDTSNRNIRNHSGKVTLCTRLYDQQFDEQAIMARSGHRSAAVRDYKRPSEELKRSVSSALQPRPSRQATATPPPPHEPDVKPDINTEVPSTNTNKDPGCLEIVLPATIHTVIITKNGRKSSIAV